MSFDPEEYDSWYERHKDIYEMEVKAIERFSSRYENPMLEIGVGTGRFAQALGIEYGIDPDEKMLEFAKRRGIKAKKGVGEELPFSSEFFNMVLISTSLSFFKDVRKVLEEAHRVLKKNGGLVIGFIPRNSYYGKKYMEMRKNGDKRFENTYFYTFEEVEELLSGLFEIKDSVSTLIPGEFGKIINSVVEDASFIVIHSTKL